jgi:hypothetical protein
MKNMYPRTGGVRILNGIAHHAVKWQSFTKQVYNQMFYNLRNFLNQLFYNLYRCYKNTWGRLFKSRLTLTQD